MSAKQSVPSYRRHKQSGQAVVTLPDALGNRKDVLLGKYGTQESRQEYAKVIAEWEAAGRQLPSSKQKIPDITIAELIDRYWPWVKNYYRRMDGTETQEVAGMEKRQRVPPEMGGCACGRQRGGQAASRCGRLLIACGAEFQNSQWTRICGVPTF